MMDQNRSRGLVLDFIIKHINKRYSLGWLWGAFTLEIFLIFPLDFVIIFYALQNKKKVYFVSIGAAFCSTVSAAIGYVIGAFAFNHLSGFIFKFITQATFTKIAYLYQVYEKGVVFLGAFFPLPFKVVTISAGICKLPIFTFLLTIFIARVLRFLLISLLTIQLEDKIFNVIEKYSLMLLGSIGLLLLVIYLWFLR